MEHLLVELGRIAREKNLPVLLIGGHAVTVHGHPRATFDVDLLIPRSDAEAWKACLAPLGYRLFAENRQFIQFEAVGSLPLPPVDLMLVEENVFRALEATREDREPLAVPGLRALIALKLHAASQASRDDRDKDWSDVFQLMTTHGLDLDDGEFAAMVLRHGGEAAIERIRAHFGG